MPAHDMTANITCTGCTHSYADTALFCPNCGRPKVRDLAGDALLGKVLGERFQVQSILGHGSSGTIYRAEHITLRRKVAIKVLHAELSRDDLAVERFRREATTVAEIDNEHIVEIHDFGRAPDGRLYLAMELLEGETLDAVIEREGTLSVERAANVLIQVGEALMEAHAIGYVHRDLRPRNVYLAVRRGRANFVKLLDFGLAKLVETDASAASTSLGMTFGDPRYMAPEQARGDRIDLRADIYQLGCVAYEMLTGAPPFAGNRVFDILTKQVTETPQPLPARRRDIPLWMEASVARMLAKDPDNRFATTTRMVEALRRGLETGEVMDDEVARRRESVPPPSVSRVMHKMGLSAPAELPAPGPQRASYDGSQTVRGHSLSEGDPADPAAPAMAVVPAPSAPVVVPQAPGVAPTAQAPVVAPTAQAPVVAPTPQAPALVPVLSAPAVVPQAQVPALVPVLSASAVVPQAQVPDLVPAVASTPQSPAGMPVAAPAPALAPQASAVAQASLAMPVPLPPVVPQPIASAAPLQSAAPSQSAGTAAADSFSSGQTHQGMAVSAKPDSVELLRKRTGTPRLGVPVVGGPAGLAGAAGAAASATLTGPAVSAASAVPPEDSQSPVAGVIETAAAAASTPRGKRPTGGDPQAISQVWFEDDEDAPARPDRVRRNTSASATDLTFDDEPPRRRRWGLIIAGLAVLLGGGIALAMTLGGGSRPRQPEQSAAAPAAAPSAPPSTFIDTPEAAPAPAPAPAGPPSTAPAAARTDRKPAAPASAPSARAPSARRPGSDDLTYVPPPDTGFRRPGGGGDTVTPPAPTPTPKDPGPKGVSGADLPQDPYGTADAPGGGSGGTGGSPEKQSEFYANLGGQQLAAGDSANAAASFKKALELDPRSVAATIGMGEIALRQGLFADAIAHLQKASRLAPRSARIQVLTGEAYLSLGRNQDAAAAFKKALQLDPDNARARDGYNEASSRVPPADE